MADKFESAQEEFQRRIKELYAFADKMGLRIVVIVKRKSNAMAPEPPQNIGPQREPGEN